MDAAKPDQRAGRVVKILLAQHDRRQSELADHLGMDTGTMSRTIAGKRKWTLTEIEQAAEFFDVSVALFFERPEAVVRSRWFSPATPMLLPAS
jgi:antitoxin component HigA of HigAB toxin-antitoxin module